MPRTLVISDLHIGARAAVSVLERPGPLEALLAELEHTDRLVLLGDIVELMETRPRSAMGVAAPILRAIGDRLGPDRRIVLVPGNHDRPLVRSWIRAQGDALEVDSTVPAHASPFLAEIVSLLGGPARVEVRYPGVWLSDRVWATHGHYLDRHLVPVSTYGFLRRAATTRRSARGGRGVGRAAADEGYASPFDFERAQRVHASPMIRRLPRPVAVAIEEVGDLIRAATMPTVRHRVLHPRFSPLISGVLNLQMRRHSIPALARVIAQLGIDPDVVVFGHVHRLGPLAGDDPREWRGAGVRTGAARPGPGVRTGAARPGPGVRPGAGGSWRPGVRPGRPGSRPGMPGSRGGPVSGSERPSFVNTGSWLYEPLLVFRAKVEHPYWPGGAVVLEDDAPPRAVGLLAGLSAAELR